MRKISARTRDAGPTGVPGPIDINNGLEGTRPRFPRDSFWTYRSVGMRLVDGWLEAPVLDALRALDRAQRRSGVGGAAAEIGVHHGKLFVALHILRRQDEKSIAIDLFEDQERNIDKSGRGDRARFLVNLQRWTTESNVVVHRGDSTELAGTDVMRLAGSAIRMFSVDGGHTEEIVEKDMATAEESLSSGGIVLSDDVFNSEWPGVFAGTMRYKENGGTLVPFCVGFNKVFFTQPEFADRYRDALETEFSSRARVFNKQSSMLGSDVIVLRSVRLTPRRVLSRNAALKRIYRAIAR